MTKNKTIPFVAGAALLLQFLMSACTTEDQLSVGIYPEEDGIGSQYATYNLTTKSASVGSVLFNSPESYIGLYSDPETGSEVCAEFAAQFHSFEGYHFPGKELLRTDPVTGKPTIDSIEVRLFVKEYYGDKNNPMKLEVFPLSKTKVMEEGKDYYVDTPLSEYAEQTTAPIATKVFTARDYIVSDSHAASSSYATNIRIPLPTDFGNTLLNAYYDDTTPDKANSYRDSYAFIHKLFPGFYFRIKSGKGTMLSIQVGTINMYFSYYDEAEKDTASAICRFASTPEVIQSTQFTYSDLSPLLQDETCTYLKTPSAICTEVTLPVKEMYLQHANDSISKAQVTFTRLNNKVGSLYSLGIPQTILMVRKGKAESFFQNHEVADGQTSVTTSFNSAYNSYTFDNIGRLITYCQWDKRNGMARTGLSEEEWEAENPDWNKVMLIPVKVSTTTDASGISKQTSVTHDMTMCSTRLLGGKDNPIKMQVVYSNFRK